MSCKLPITLPGLCIVLSLYSCDNGKPAHPEQTSPAADHPTATSPAPTTDSKQMNDLRGLWLKGPVHSVTMTSYSDPSAALLARDAPDSSYRKAVQLETLSFNEQGFLVSHAISASLNNTQATYLRFRTDSTFANGVHMISVDHADRRQANTRLNYWSNPNEYHMALMHGDMSAVFGFYFNDSGKQVKADQVITQGDKHQTNFERAFQDMGTEGYSFVEHNYLTQETDTVHARYLAVDEHGNPRKVQEIHSRKDRPTVLRFYSFNYY